MQSLAKSVSQEVDYHFGLFQVFFCVIPFNSVKSVNAQHYKSFL